MILKHRHDIVSVPVKEGECQSRLPQRKPIPTAWLAYIKVLSLGYHILCFRASVTLRSSQPMLPSRTEWTSECPLLSPWKDAPSCPSPTHNSICSVESERGALPLLWHSDGSPGLPGQMPAVQETQLFPLNAQVPSMAALLHTQTGAW